MKILWKKTFLCCAAAALLPALRSAPARAAATSAFRPPAVPLVTFDPYMSIWSEGNRLANHRTRYWDGRVQSLDSLIRIDGRIFRLMGKQPGAAPTMRQLGVRVLPTQTIYRFANPAVRVTLTFTTPRLPAHLTTMTLPVTYITLKVISADGHAHRVQLYFSAQASIALNDRWQRAQLACARKKFGPLTALKCGNTVQNYFDVSGDPVGLDWGYFYTAANSKQSMAVVAAGKRCMKVFAAQGTLPGLHALQTPALNSRHHAVEAFAFNLGRVGTKAVSRHLLMAYDEVYAIDYFGQRQRPYWRKQFKTPAKMLQWAAAHYTLLMKKSAAFDAAVLADARKAGGRQYAAIAALAYRQSLAAMGISADSNGQPMVFTKEETSNGDIATVDVIFPASPLLLTFCPQLEAASIAPVFISAETPRWRFPFAPHDLGTYPICTGHYANGGENMMVEESGNMILLSAAIARAQGSAAFAAHFWPLLTRWVEYLRKSGFDPGNQLSTNDFLGNMTHNANLSVKAIVAMGAYGLLCRMRGMTAEGDAYQALARRWARKWMKVDATGNHYRMAFNQPHSWSMLYNLVWDQALGLHIFPRVVRRKEMAFYMTQLHPYGLPDRGTVTQTKTDFEIWTATLATKPAQFHAIIHRIYHFLDTSPARVPFADQYGTNKAWAGMHARPVMGAAFMPMMARWPMWKHWASQGAKFGNHWAPLPPIPPKPVYATIVATARHKPVLWRYTTKKPSGQWRAADYYDKHWKIGPAGFGAGYPKNGIAQIRTPWTTANIWLRRAFTMPHVRLAHLRIYTFHDEDVSFYINGVFAASAGGYSYRYVPLKISQAALAALHAGRNVLAAHVHQTTGGQFFDVGIVQARHAP